MTLIVIFGLSLAACVLFGFPSILLRAIAEQEREEAKLGERESAEAQKFRDAAFSELVEAWRVRDWDAFNPALELFETPPRHLSYRRYQHLVRVHEYYKQARAENAVDINEAERNLNEAMRVL